MIRFCALFFILYSLSISLVTAKSAITTPIPINNIKNYDHYPLAVKDLIQQATTLSKQNLTYTYGSANPQNGGMDCSGTMNYLLKKEVDDVPRSSNEMYAWVKQKGKLYKVSKYDFDSSEFSHLKPGDLLFWSGTCSTQCSSSITHVMLYLGRNNKNEPIMFGSSNGRQYKRKTMWGVSVFDFYFPSPHSKAKFIGYSCIPDLTCSS